MQSLSSWTDLLHEAARDRCDDDRCSPVDKRRSVLSTRMPCQVGMLCFDLAGSSSYFDMKLLLRPFDETHDDELLKRPNLHAIQNASFAATSSRALP